MTTRTEAQTFMLGYILAKLAVRAKQLEAASINSAILSITQTYSDMPRGNGSGNSTESMLLGYLLIKEQLTEEIAQAYAVRSEIQEVVNIVKAAKPLHGAILQCRYLDRMRVKDIAKDLNYSPSRIKQIAAEALDDVALILSTGNYGRSNDDE